MSYLAFEHTAVAARPALTRTITGVLLVFTLLTTAFASGAAARDGIDLRAVTADPGPDVGPITPAVHEFVADDVGLIVAAGPSPVGRLTGQNWSRSPGCDVDFNDADALNIQPGQAITQFVSDPWREACGTVFTEIEGSIYDHLHLDFVDPDIGPCLNPWEELAGSYARIIGDDPWEATCEEIDPLTEPRTSPWAHGSDEVVRIRTYDEDGYQPFRLDRIRVKDKSVRVCAQPVGVGPFEVAGPPMPGELPGATCWVLTPGYWDLSGHNDHTGVVTITGAPGTSGPFSFDDIALTDQS